MSWRGGARRETLFEFRPIGQQVRVAAIDSETGIEVVVVAPASASEEQMKSVAAAKLRRRIAQETGLSGS